MNWLLHALIAFLVLLGCNVPFTPEAFNASPEAIALRGIVDRLVAHDIASIQAQLDPRLVETDIRGALERTANAIPAAPITKVEGVSWNVSVGTSQSRTASVAAEYAFGGKQWLVASAELTGEPSGFRILRFNVEPLPAPMAQIHAFTFVDKGPMHYVFFLAAAVAFLVSVVALVRCVRAKGLRRKWLWVLFVVFGFVSFTINWSTGAVQVNPLALNLMSASFMRNGWLGPWMLTFCIPVGAIIFLWRQRSTSHNVPAAS